jgi:hypothetical protein
MCVSPSTRDATAGPSSVPGFRHMQSYFASRALSLEQMFSDPLLFDSPVYQRPFAWTIEEAAQLLDDMLSTFESGGGAGAANTTDYFIGAILLDDPAQSPMVGDDWPWAGKVRVFNIVDGQQRLVTLTVLFCVLRDLIAARAPATAFALSKCVRADDPRSVMSGERHRVRLRGRENDNLAHNVQRRGACSEQPVFEAVSAAELRLLEVRQHFISVLEDRDPFDLAGFAKFLLEKCTVVAIATRNIDRAHRMFTVLNNTGKDLARSDILKAELLGTIARGEEDHYADFWDEASALLGDHFEVLFSHIRTVQGKSGGAIIAAVRQVIAEAGGAAPFIDNVMRPAAHILDQIMRCRYDGDVHAEDIGRALRHLSWLQGSEWVPVLMAWWLKHGADSAALFDFLKLLDAHCYGTRLLGLGVDKRAQRLAPVLASIRAGDGLEQVGQALSFSKDDHRAITKNLRELHLRSQSTCKLVLLRINNHLSPGQMHLEPADWTVEHVLPLKPALNSLWRSWYPEAEERQRCAGSLGNFTLVTRAQNEKARNLDLALKLPIYFAPSVHAAPHLLDHFRGRLDWRVRDVMAREAAMYDAIATLWRVGPSVRRGAFAEPVSARA